MRTAFFASKSAEVSEHCRLARDDMFRILEHLMDPVDRVAVARECVKRITAAVRIRHIFRRRRVYGAAEELNGSLELAVRTIEWLLSYRYHRSELERPVELETSKILVEAIGVIVGAGTLKITRLKELGRTFYRLKDSSWHLEQRARAGAGEFAGLDEALLDDIQNGASWLNYTADNVEFEITQAIHGLRRNRRRRDD